MDPRVQNAAFDHKSPAEMDTCTICRMESSRDLRNQRSNWDYGSQLIFIQHHITKRLNIFVKDVKRLLPLCQDNYMWDMCWILEGQVN